MTLQQAAHDIGIEYRTAARWVADGLVRVDGGTRQGRRTPWADRYTRELRNIARLRDAGLSMPAIREVADTLRDLSYGHPAHGRFAVIGGPPGERRVLGIGDEREAAEILGRNRGELLLFVPLDMSESERVAS